jgi:ligand-binding sensor domain-containing protein
MIKCSVSELYIDIKQQLWVGNGSNIGLFIVDLNLFSSLKEVKYKHLKTKPGVKGCISKNTITAIYEDEAGDIWLGTYGGGINYYSPREKKFVAVKKVLNEINSLSDDLVNAFLEDEKFLWIGTESGLDRIDKKTGIYSHFYKSNNPADLVGSSIYALHKDSKGFVWYGSWAGGLNRYDPVSQTFINYSADNKPGSLCSSNVFSIYEDSRGNFWVGTIRGDLIYLIKNRRISMFCKQSNDSASLNKRRSERYTGNTRRKVICFGV